MRRHTFAFLSLSASLLFGACAPIRYDVRVDAHDRGVMPPTARVMVIAATHTDPKLGPEVEGKIERLLKERGFQIVQPRSDSDTVDLVVLATFGSGEPTTGSSGTAVVQLANLLPQVPRARAAQNRWLIVAVARPAALSGGAAVQAVPWLWYATTFADVTNSSLAQVIDYLLVPTFEWWGKTTGSRISTPIEQYDPRVRVLINPPE